MVRVGDAALTQSSAGWSTGWRTAWCFWHGKFCRLEDYRRPAHFELELLQEHPGCFLVIAARNGFEDDPADVEWGFSFLLPEMAEASCQAWHSLWRK